MFDLPAYVRNAIDKLQNAGFEAYVVGGCVRDFLMGTVPHDYDMTTSALPRQTLEVFSDFPVIETGIKHGTVTVVTPSGDLEITTYRVDGSYSDSRHPDSVCFTRSLKEDTLRRDFTINAMAYTPDKGLVDYHQGRDDLRSELIRCVGDSRRRFGEDALRIIRALRFSSQLGFRLESETEKAAFELAPLLKNVSPERLQSELIKLLCGKDARRVTIQYVRILANVIPELLPLENFDQRNIHHIHDVLTHTAIAVENVPPLVHLRLSALLHDIGKPSCFSVDTDGVGHFYSHADASTRMAEDILTRLRFGNTLKEKVLTLVKRHDIPIAADEKSVKKALNKLGKDTFFDLMALKRADNLAQNPLYRQRQQEITELETIARFCLEQEQCFSLRDMAVNGNDLISLGLKPGKVIGEVLDLLLEAVIDGKCENTKDALTEYAMAHFIS